MQSTEQAPQAAPDPNSTAAQAVPRQAYRRTPVVYLTGFYTKSPNNRHDAVLEWSADNRIRLFTIDASGSQVAMLDCAPQDIKRFSTGMGIANIIMKTGQRFTVEFSDKLANQLIAGAAASQFGLGGFAVGTALDQRAVQTEAATDIEWWTENLARFGIGGLQTSAKTIYSIDKVGWWVIYAILGVTVLFGLVAGVIFLISALGIA